MSDLSDEDYEDYEDYEDFYNHEGGVFGRKTKNNSERTEETPFNEIDIETVLKGYFAIDGLEIKNLINFNNKYNDIMIKILNTIKTLNNLNKYALTLNKEKLSNQEELQKFELELNKFQLKENEIAEMGEALIGFVNNITGSREIINDKVAERAAEMAKEEGAPGENVPAATENKARKNEEEGAPGNAEPRVNAEEGVNADGAPEVNPEKTADAPTGNKVEQAATEQAATRKNEQAATRKNEQAATGKNEQGAPGNKARMNAQTQPPTVRAEVKAGQLPEFTMVPMRPQLRTTSEPQLKSAGNKK